MSGLDSPERHYELVERIAVGGMAEVFRAKAYGPHGFEKLLAIKRILPALAQDPKFERRFITEAKVAVSLSHANIVQVFDFSRFGQSLYIVMELVDGCDVLRALEWAREHGGGLVPREAAMHVAVELLKGLDFAHKRGVVHRDISPSNILLSRAGEVKIADFGIAQMGGFEMSRTLKVIGKWRYMSPEQTRAEELDARSDLFSAAVVIYELLTGQRLFTGSDPGKIAYQMETMDMPRVSDLRTDLPPAFDEPLLAALERDRDKRTIGADGLLEALLAACYAHSIPAMPTSLTRYLEQVMSTAEKQSGNGAGAPLLDQIIVSEIGAGKPAAKPGGARRTAMALAPPRLHPDDALDEEHQPEALPEEHEPEERGEQTAVTMIRSFTNPDGTRHWMLEERDTPVDAASMIPTIAESGMMGVPGLMGVPAAMATPVPIAAPPVYEMTSSVAPMPPTSRRFWLMVAGSALAAGVVVVLASRLFAGGPDQPAPVATADPAAEQPPPAVTADAGVNTEAVLETDLSDAGSAGGERGKDEVPTRERESARGGDEVPTRERESTERESAERLRYGTVDIFSDPWANIYLGKKKIGTAPQRGVRLPVGRHRLKLVNPVQGRTAWVTVTVPSTRPVRVLLPEAPFPE